MTKSTPSAAAHAARRWYIVDAADQVLGRLASDIAHVLMGKNRSDVTLSVDDGDFIVVINAEKVRLTGGKEQKKVYHWHTGWMGGIRSMTANKLRERKPTELLRRAVHGMLPKGTLGRNMNKKLKLFVGPHHNMQSQQPVPLPIYRTNSPLSATKKD